MARYLGYTGGLDYAQFGDTIYLWARGAWRKFCRALEWFHTWPGKSIRKVFFHGHWISLKACCGRVDTQKCQ
jgi:hypothetical protein